MCAQPATAAIRLMAAPARTAAGPAELSEGLAGPNFPPSRQQRRHFGANQCPACSPDQPVLIVSLPRSLLPEVFPTRPVGGLGTHIAHEPADQASEPKARLLVA